MARFEADELVASQLNAHEGVLEIGNKTDVTIGHAGSSVAVVGQLTVNSGSEAAFSFPQTAGQASQILTSDGSGGTQWAPGGGGGAVTQIEAADTSCKVQCLDGGTVEMSNSTQTYFQSDNDKTQIKSPADFAAITLSSSLSTTIACNSGIALYPGSGFVQMSGYRMPNNTPMTSGQVMVSDDSGVILWWKRPPAFTQSFGSATADPVSYLALNGTILTPSYSLHNHGYCFVVPAACALSRVSIDVDAVSGCQIQIQTSTGSTLIIPTSPAQTALAFSSIELAPADVLWVGVIAATLNSGIVTCFFDWIMPTA